ncbi:hypothetical protein [Halocatena halophila]
MNSSPLRRRPTDRLQTDRGRERRSGRLTVRMAPHVMFLGHQGR